MPMVMVRDVPDLGMGQMTRSRPVFFDGCFGWLHLAPHGSAVSVAVLLCPGLTTDRVTGHRSFRLLGDALAADGYPTLRFDYPGTGDSGDCGSADPWTAWQQSIQIAADWLRQHSGAQRIVLCGLRLGAMLAALVAEARNDVDGLILLAPVLRGRTYIRQLGIEASMRQATTPDCDLVVQELRLPSQTVRAISQADLRKVTLSPECSVSIYAQEASPVLSECAAVWTKCGANVVHNDFAGLEAMLRPAYMSHEAPAQVSRVVAWLRAWIPVTQSELPVIPLPDHVSQRLDSSVETPLRFGASGHLFGILCRPLGRTEADLVVVIGSAGGDPHYGFARRGTDLARRLAARGIASLRMDFDGLGDSGVPGGAATHIFETDRRPDITAAIDALGHLGFRRFAIQGLCSAAYHALHAALADRRISHAVLINLPLFQWRKGDAIELLSFETKSRAELLRRLVHPAHWRSLLSRYLDLRNSSAMPDQWLIRRAEAMGRRMLGLSSLGNPSARKCMYRLSQQAKTLLLFAEGDPGIKVLERAFGSGRAPPGTTMRIIPGLDHGLATNDMRGVVVEQIAGFLNQDLEFFFRKRDFDTVLTR